MSKDDATRAQLHMTAGYLPRFLLTGATLAVSVIFLGLFGIFGAMAGTSSMTISAYIVRFSNKKNVKGGE
jgi:hypothetical protein